MIQVPLLGWSVPWQLQEQDWLDTEVPCLTTTWRDLGWRVLLQRVSSAWKLKEQDSRDIEVRYQTTIDLELVRSLFGSFHSLSLQSQRRHQNSTGMEQHHPPDTPPNERA